MYWTRVTKTRVLHTRCLRLDLYYLPTLFSSRGPLCVKVYNYMTADNIVTDTIGENLLVDNVRIVKNKPRVTSHFHADYQITLNLQHDNYNYDHV